MPISKFKATCLAALERVRRTGRPLRVTRFGRPVADIVPPAPGAPAPRWLGSLRGTATTWVDSALARAPMRDAALTASIAALSRRLDVSTQDPAGRFSSSLASRPAGGRSATLRTPRPAWI